MTRQYKYLNGTFFWYLRQKRVVNVGISDYPIFLLLLFNGLLDDVLVDSEALTFDPGCWLGLSHGVEVTPRLSSSVGGRVTAVRGRDVERPAAFVARALGSARGGVGHKTFEK